MSLIPIGYKAICEQLCLKTPPHYRESYITTLGRGKVNKIGPHETHLYPKSYALTDPTDPLENLAFALKYDGMNFAIIKALYERIEKNQVTDYIHKQPTGIYARKIWFLYEFFMQERLDLTDCQRVKYVELL